MSSPPPFYHCNCIAIVVITINIVIISSSLRKINGNRSSSLLSSSFSSLLLLLSWRSAATALSQLNQVLPQPGLHIARSDPIVCPTNHLHTCVSCFRSVVAQLGLFFKQSIRVAPADTPFMDPVSSTSGDPVSALFSIDLQERMKKKVLPRHLCI